MCLRAVRYARVSSGIHPLAVAGLSLKRFALLSLQQ